MSCQTGALETWVQQGQAAQEDTNSNGPAHRASLHPHCELESSVPCEERAPDIQKGDMSEPLGAQLAPELTDQAPEAILLITGPCSISDFRKCRAFLCNIQTCLFQCFVRCWLSMEVTCRNQKQHAR